MSAAKMPAKIRLVIRSKASKKSRPAWLRRFVMRPRVKRVDQGIQR
jgi:hypothetical protein